MSEPILFGAAYYPEDWPESERPYDIKMMKEAGMNVMRFGEFAWRKMEPKPGEYDFKWLHDVIDDLAAAGIKSILGTPTATPPRWFLKQYPDAAKLNADGYRTPHGGRRHCCSNNPDYQRESEKIVTAMAKEFGSDPNVIGWQLDNEIYTHDSGCTCPHCMDNFHKHLENKYGTIEALNAAWNLNLFSQAYDAFDEIPAPIHGWQNPHIRLEWHIAHYQSDIDFIHSHAAILRQYTKAPIGTDMMPLNGMGYEDMTEPMDVIQYNHYNIEENLPTLPFWFDHFRSFGKPFWNTETATNWNGSEATTQPMKPEGFCTINSWLPVALGGEANLYWLWRQHWAGHELIHGSVLYANGRPHPIFGEVQQISEGFKAAESFLRDTNVESQLALHFTSQSWKLFEVQSVVKDFGYWDHLANDFYRPIAQLGLRPDVIGARKSLDEYKVLVSPLVMTLDDEGLGDRIEAWVRDGGIWVVGPMTDIRTNIGTHYTDRALGWIERMTSTKMIASMPDSGVYVKSRWADGEPMAARYWQEVYEPVENGEVLASVTEGYSSLIGSALIQKIPCGKGQVWILGTVPKADDFKKLMRQVCDEAGIALPEVSGEITVVPRSGNGREGLILLETAHKPGSFVLDEPMHDVVTGEVYEGRIEFPPYGMLILEK